MGSLIFRWRRFAQRNEGRLLYGLQRFVVGRIWANRAVRRAFRVFTSSRLPNRWVFLVGCYNSGTTLLRDLLGAHPSIATLPREGVRFTEEFPELQKGGWQRMLLMNRDDWAMPRDDIQRRKAKIVKDWSPLWKSGAHVYLEKSIEHSVRMEWLDAAFDAPYFISIVRNGYCVCEGILRKAVPRGEARTTVGDSYPISLAAKQWVAINEQIDQESRRVRNVLHVSYESLVSNPIGTLKSIFSFIGVDCPEMSFRHGQVFVAGQKFRVSNQNMRSLARLSPREVAEATPQMRKVLAQYGYEILEEK